MKAAEVERLWVAVREVLSEAIELGLAHPDTPLDLIIACRPDVLVKGGDWPVERIVGAREVLARGGRVESIAFEHERSTTALLCKIRAL